MKIDTTKIDGYSEMNAEQKLAALEAFEYEDNSAEIERLKNANSKANSEAAEWKRKHNALLSEDEQKKAQDAETLASMKAELENLRKEKTISDYTARYIAVGYDKELAAQTANAFVSGDMDKVFANEEKHQNDLKNKIKAELMNGTPAPSGGSPVDKDKPDLAVEKAKEIVKARKGGETEYNSIMEKYIKK